jgi:hypothetical protein
VPVAPFNTGAHSGRCRRPFLCVIVWLWLYCARLCARAQVKSFKCEPIVIAALQRANNDIEKARRLLDDPVFPSLICFINDEKYFDEGGTGTSACCVFSHGYSFPGVRRGGRSGATACQALFLRAIGFEAPTAPPAPRPQPAAI